MERMPEEQFDEDDQTQEVSLTRKIIIFVFIIGFWLFFYWYKSPSQEDKTRTPAQEHPLETQEKKP